jgi:ADP-heptose:LPS heptosyltransferase/GT2 family glycosyltransferase
MVTKSNPSKTRVQRNITHNALIVANLESIFAYSGRLKGKNNLESLNKVNDQAQYILVSSEIRPKTIVLSEGELPLAFFTFSKIEGDESLKYVGKKLSSPAYIAHLDFPDLVKKSIRDLWMGKFSIDFEKIGLLQFSAKRNLAGELQNSGNPDNIKRNLDAVKLRLDIAGNTILEVDGWALSETSESCSVSLFFDDEKIATTLTNKIRQDVLEFYKLNVPITPGFVISAQLPSPTPKFISLLIKSDKDSVALKFPFDKIPGASKFEIVEETIFKDFLDDEVDESFVPHQNFSRFIRPDNQQPIKPISIVIPTNLSTANIFDLIRKLREASPGDEIIVIAHGISAANKSKLSEMADRVIQVEGKFNWSKFNNKGASIAKNDTLLFMNDDVFPISVNWRSVLSRAINENKVFGAIGARLVGKDLKIQHDGISLYGKFTNHVNVGLGTLSNLNKSFLQVDAVTGAFLLTNKKLFESINGFDETLNIVGNDLDYCLRLGSNGFNSLIPTNLIFYHAEGSSRANLADNDTGSSLDVRLPSAGRMRVLDEERSIDTGAEKIALLYRTKLKPKNIAIVKIDHIGDFYSSLEAIKILQKSFEGAKLSLICSPEVAPIAKKIHIFSEIYPVRVFNKISGSGLEFNNLPISLKQKKFDLAIDFRKHDGDGEREILNGIKAEHKFCFKSETGQDNLNTIYFSGHKEQRGVNYIPSICDEYLAFSNFVTNCCNSYPTEIGIEDLKESFKSASLSRRKIAIFPQSGNTARAYPLALYMQFAIFEKKLNPKAEITFYVPQDQIGSFIGIDAMEELKKANIFISGLNDTSRISEVIKAADLVVTNNTGPMWIASAEGTPCIAVFSSVVSRTHWLPHGVYQLSRNASCAPCYIAAADQCHRNMFCLNSIDPSYINLVAEYIFSSSKIPTPRKPRAIVK